MNSCWVRSPCTICAIPQEHYHIVSHSDSDAVWPFGVVRHLSTIPESTVVSDSCMAAFVMVWAVWLATACSVAAEGAVRGVRHEDSAKFQGSSFACGDGVIAASRVNDNYCDCLDGADEPGTRALCCGAWWGV